MSRGHDQIAADILPEDIVSARIRYTTLKNRTIPQRIDVKNRDGDKFVVPIPVPIHLQRRLVFLDGAIISLCELQTEELVKIAISRNGNIIQYVRDLKTEDLCYLAAQNGAMLVHIPVECRTSRVRLAAVKKNGSSLEYIPVSERTHEEIITAIKTHAHAITFLPEQDQTPNLCKLAVKCGGAVILQQLPESKCTPELVELAVTKHPMSIIHVKNAPPALYALAVRLRGDAITQINFVNITWDMCVDAVTQNPWLIGFVPERFRSGEELCKIAGRRNYTAFTYCGICARCPMSGGKHVHAQIGRTSTRWQGCSQYSKFIAEKWWNLSLHLNFNAMSRIDAEQTKRGELLRIILWEKASALTEVGVSVALLSEICEQFMNRRNIHLYVAAVPNLAQLWKICVAAHHV